MHSKSHLLHTDNSFILNEKMAYTLHRLSVSPLCRRDKTLNYFNIMLKKRVKNEDKDTELDEEEKAAKSKASKSGKKRREFVSIQCATQR